MTTQPMTGRYASLASCILTLGTRDFFDHFFDFISLDFLTDQCMVFLFDEQKRISCLLFKNFRKEDLAKPLAQSYIEEGYRDDPNFDSISALHDGETRTIHLDKLFESMSDGYRKQFFSDPSLADKVSIITGDSGRCYYINLYRGNHRRRFNEDGLFTDNETGNIVAALVVQHYRLNLNFLKDGPLAFLSDRERQVCREILQGKKLEAIAFDLSLAASTVITYRKRAYEKLGIASRGALFSLCQH